jgi:hypothetical protein
MVRPCRRGNVSAIVSITVGVVVPDTGQQLLEAAGPLRPTGHRGRYGDEATADQGSGQFATLPRRPVKDVSLIPRTNLWGSM